ncbi:Glutamyl-tRNA amidotransferase B subunit [Pholiota conissans]|uniref:Glutamyl-tRNA(Gln) amidotransferase subunit B, mitochondrial n=1 Tax=Pholiota conissans TaxID=109636 RepID=A0A9P5YZK0_9AGAR|nr:Glutamyl-tRNA amidotransferase B subunit [Pholiota conissans]
MSYQRLLQQQTRLAASAFVVAPSLCRSSYIFNRRSFHGFRKYQEDPRWPGWQVIVGIETHAQIKSRRKLFSDAFNSNLDDEPNTHVVPFDAAFPGTLPKLNPKCVDLGLRTAVALKCDINRRSSFDRKHYFYSDLPSGYQITQQYSPLAMNGALQVTTAGGEPFTVRIKQIQLEQDTAKSTFNPRTRTSRIDLNRAGAGLMEIVSEPDMRSPEEAAGYVRTLQSILRAMGSSDGNMEQGSMRCDVNISVNRKGETPGTRCEIKNLNSVRFMMAAITHEVHRQIAFLAENPGEHVPQETRGFNEDTFTTFRLRSKEDAPDYRYMPDANLGVLVLSEARINEIKSTLPPLPHEVRERLLEKYPVLRDKARQASLDVLLVNNERVVGLDGEDAGGAIRWFDELCEGGRDPALVLNWLTQELMGQLASRKETLADNTLSVSQFGALVDMVASRTLTGTSGKFLLRHMLANPSQRPMKEIAEELELIALAPSTSSSPQLHALCTAAIAALPSEVAAVRAGNKNVLNKIVGHVMRASRGRADALVVRVLVEELVFEEKNA